MNVKNGLITALLVGMVVSAANGQAAAPGANLLKNPSFASTDGYLPDMWKGGRGAQFAGAFTTTGGVLRISESAAAYCHGVTQTMRIDGTKSYWFEADLKCDAVSYKANVLYSLLDEKGKPIISS